MSLMQSISTPATEKNPTVEPSTTSSGFFLDIQKIMGCLYLVVSVFILSSNIVLQAFALEDFPAPMSLSAITSLLGAIMTAIVQLLENHQLRIGLLLVSSKDLIGYCVMTLKRKLSMNFLSWDSYWRQSHIFLRQILGLAAVLRGLNFLVTRYWTFLSHGIFISHTDIDPGVLTDLRSVSVNNDNFAQVAVRQNLLKHLLHSSGLLLKQVLDFAKLISESDIRSLPGVKAPKKRQDGYANEGKTVDQVYSSSTWLNVVGNELVAQHHDNNNKNAKESSSEKCELVGIEQGCFITLNVLLAE